MARLSEIAFRLPATPESRAWLGALRTLLSDVPYGEFADDRLTLTPPVPAGALPRTAFALADVRTPEIGLDTGPTFGVEGDGEGDGSPEARPELAALSSRLAGHIQRVDHTGVNLPMKTTTSEQWQNALSTIAGAATMYRYPTGEDWPFVLPSTAAELADDIRAFVVGREPRFEVVYDQGRTQPEWQFALRTDLTRGELEDLFPEPEGITFPGLEEIFRVVAIRHPWTGLGIRFDLMYRMDGGPNDWETGEWLVTQGGRIR